MARPGGSGPPISLKTVPGRNRTQKWNIAKQYDYSGDDWGGYDPYDDYSPSPYDQQQQQQQHSAPATIPEQPNFPTPLPSQLPSRGRGAQMSFDDNERRQFSAGPVLHGGNGNGNEGSRGVSPAKSATSNTSAGKRRDFTNPEQVPPPLNTTSRGSPALSSSSAPAGISPGGASFPPRQSSVGSGSSPAPETVAPTKTEKELPTPPFIRPSEIYKRMAAEQEKARQASESSGRPSMESLRRETDSPGNLSASGRERRPLSAVEEGPQEQGVEVPERFGEPDYQSSGGLPPVTKISSFGSDWFPGGKRTSTEEQETTPTAVRTIGATATAEPLSATSSSSLQMTPTTTRSTPAAAADPAAEILAERTHDVPVSEIGKQPQPDELAHQPSQGYRSIVNRAFDHSANSGSVPATPISRDNSLSTAASDAVNVSRSNTDSTSSISPIMSRVPSAATAQMQRQQQQQQAIPTIAEEPRGRVSSEEGSAAMDAGIVAAGAAATGAAAVGLASGYRRSFSPPSPGNSPARTPGLESTGERRLSEGLAAETVTSSSEEAPGVPDQDVELQPTLDTAEETPVSEIGEARALPESSGFNELPTTAGRARAGTDYSMRESDIADAINHVPSPDQPATMSAAEAAGAEKAEQSLFLRTHEGIPTNQISPQPFGTATPPPRTGTPASGRASPAKNRVRDLADKFQEIHEASRRNSQASLGSTKSSWSRFGSDEKAAMLPKRQGTQESNVVSESDYGGGDDYDDDDHGRDGGGEVMTRPEIGSREQSFRPQLPGGWVSFRDSPAVASPSAAEEYSPVTALDDDEEEGEADVLTPAVAVQDHTTPRASYEGQQERVDLTPTMRKVPLDEPEAPSHFDQTKDAGSALGASLLTSVGMGHKTRDFGSDEPAQPVDQPEMQLNPPTGDLGYLQAPQRPEISRGDIEATDVTDVASAASSVPPTPPAKDTPPPQSSSVLEPGGNYSFSVAPLRTGRSREGSPELGKSVPAFPTVAGAGAGRTGISPPLSMHPRSSDMESDRLRKEIVKSLDSAQMEQKIEEDTERTQDALDAPGNAGRVAEGGEALPPAEQDPMRMLDQRFSFERKGDEVFGGSGFGDPAVEKELPPPPRVLEPQPEPSPEIKPEMPYERPRARGLHIMNADEDVDDDATAKLPEREEALSRGLSVATSSAGPVSPITKSQENLHLGSVVDSTRDGGDGLSAPSPVSEGKESLGLPSYYMLEVPGLEARVEEGGEDAPEVREGPVVEDVDQPALRPSEDTPRPISKDMSSPTSPTSKQKIPPFREILAIKSPADRIKTYDETRRTFADMNTGLSDWLSGMLAQHPEHASLSIPHGGYGAATAAAASERLESTKGHKGTPSLAKFTRQFSGSAPRASESPQGGDYQPGAEPIPPKTPSKDFGDMDKLQQRGKDLMKNAGVLGGRAQAGAKGLFAKGKNRFGSTRESKGGSKDLSSNQSLSNSSSTLTSVGPKILDRSDPNTILQPTPIQVGRTHDGSQSSSLVAPRSGNQTPSSVSSSGGPLSRTLSRLRERSRSKSASNSRGNSRPRSLIPGNAELVSIQDVSPRADNSAVSDKKSNETASAAIPPWSEPDAPEVHREVERSGMPARLGVLPSPTAATFSRDVDWRPHTAVLGSESLEGDLEPPSALQASQDELQLQSNSHEVVSTQIQQQVGESTQASTSRPETPITKQAEKDEEDELYDVTPVVSRSLPVQNHEDDDLYDTTPKPVQKEWKPASIDVPNIDDKKIAGEDGEVTAYESPRHAEVETVAGAENTDEALPQLQVTDAATTQESSLPTAPDNFDKKSEISVEDHDESSKEGKTETGTETPSKRSSVSSLGDRHHVSPQPRDDQHEEPVMSSQAVPAGPISSTPVVSNTGMTSDLSSAQEPRFMDRTYLPKPEVPRPLSYEPLERDPSGEVVQETLSSPSQAAPPQDWGLVSAAGEDKPFEANFTSLTRHRKQSISPTTDRRPKRLSGIYGREFQPKPVTAPAPPASAMPDEYGLGHLRDLHDLHDDSPDDSLEDEMSQQGGKQAKRKSGIWEAFRRSPSASKEDFSGRSSASKIGPPSSYDNVRPFPPTRVGGSRAMNVEQPQRASTTATEPEKKKKRFSALGSLFGRSGTTGHKMEKPKKLSKRQSSDGDNSQRQTSQPSGRIGEYDVFMVPKTPGSHPSRMDAYGQGGRGPPVIPPPVLPPPGGWYAPGNDSPLQSAQLRQAPPQNFSGLPSHGPRSGMSFSNVPEAFRPVDSSYNRPVAQIRPPQGPLPPLMSSQATRPPGFNMQGNRVYHPQAPYQPQQQFISDPARGRESSNTSTEYPLSPQVSGQSEWQRSGGQHRRSTPTVSPVESKPDSDGYPAGRTVRVGSISEEIARSPAREYQDQQTPFQISMPQGAGQAQSSRTSYWARQRRNAPAQADRTMSMERHGYGSPGANPLRQGLPISQRQSNADSLMESNYGPASTSLMAHPPESGETQTSVVTGAERDAYASPTTTSRQEYVSPLQDSDQEATIGERGNDQGLPSTQPETLSGNPYLSVQLPNLGDSNRQGDYSDGEETIVFLGASYPGQEWIPSQWE